MKERIFALDRVLGEIVQLPRFSFFTITTLRSEYMRRITIDSSLSAPLVRRYLYKQVGRMVRIGWVVRRGAPMSRNVEYHVQEIPRAITLNLTEPAFRPKLPVESDTETLITDRNSNLTPTESSLHEIEAKLKSVRMDFISSLGEAETYKSLLAEHPFLREKLETTYHSSRDKSLNLMGQLRALEHTVRVLEEQL
ncbi:MAG: hypothetical protein Q7L07_17015 [Pseudohongiella sp.]|nr:hypothetical protein [Pseudohongiella sp.]